MSTKIKLVVETTNGAESTVLTLEQSEYGDNPRYNSQQVEQMLNLMGQRVRNMYKGIYGNQY